VLTQILYDLKFLGAMGALLPFDVDVVELGLMVGKPLFVYKSCATERANWALVVAMFEPDVCCQITRVFVGFAALRAKVWLHLFANRRLFASDPPSFAYRHRMPSVAAKATAAI
jgi:hypothetical protein